ncbi:hypothetical protein F0L68_08870 [Solihabitans fulvus]|uniref:Uncharacterized protein n=1 Tax=Solihabitans fulvus TaxID=1892852 RepID=A0A5B2XLW6_9PSEU|nr:hypothetical protein F0L68_08870 [Solihabitans fulvus]
MRRPRRGLGAVWRGFAGSLAVGLVLLALVVIGFQVYAGSHGEPGPGAWVVAGHVVAAVVAVVAQRFADRRDGPVGVLAGLGVVAVSAVTLWVFWWA